MNARQQMTAMIVMTTAWLTLADVTQAGAGTYLVPLPDGSRAVVETDGPAPVVDPGPTVRVGRATRIDAYGHCAIVVPPAGEEMPAFLRSAEEWHSLARRAGRHPEVLAC